MSKLPLALLLSLLLAACDCGKKPVGGDGGPGDDSGLDGGEDGGEDGGPVCVGGSLCGDPATCCESGNECVNGQCLAACASGVRCGATSEICCSAGSLCIANDCVTPTTACMDSYDCAEGEFCEPTVGQCVAQPPGGPTCVYEPTFSTLTPTIERSYTAHEIISIPVVANLDGVGGPEIVVNLTRADPGAANDWPTGNIQVFNGDSAGATFTTQGTMLAHNPPTSYGAHGRTTIAVGDVTGDGLPEIVYITRQNGSGQSLVAAVSIDENGTYTKRWTSWQNTVGTDYLISTGGDGGAAVTLANFDDDEMAEVVVGGTLFDHDGRFMWAANNTDHACTGANCGMNNGYEGGVSVVADLDAVPDGKPEIISGRNAFKVVWTPGNPPTAAVTQWWRYTGDDGYPAVADLDGNGRPEVVLVANRRVILLNGQTGALFCGVDPTDAMCMGNDGLRTQPVLIPGGASDNRGGPPTIADFDGDGRPEIGVAGGFSYSVYDIHRAGEVIVKPPADPDPAAGAVYVRWSRATDDDSSNATGSSVFDFQGDGAAEVVYADECYLRVYSGTDGTVQLETPNTTATIHEYPLVVDADGDGNSEILLVANNSSANTNCGSGQPSRKGLFMYGDMMDRWVPTRRVWTQHAYHVTNATSAGNVPMSELRNWVQPGLNNARQNVQGDGVFNAPDLAVSLSVGLEGCPAEHALRARVTNLGSLGVYMGVPIRFQRTSGGGTTELGTAATTIPLLPGQSQTITLTVSAPAGLQDYRVLVDDTGTVSECNEANNSGVTNGASCEIIILD